MSINSRDVLVTVPVAGALTTGVKPITVVLPFDAELISVVSAVNTAPTGAALTVDVRKNNVQVLGSSNRSTVAASSTVAPAVKAVRSIPNATVTLGAAGSVYSPGTNLQVNSPYSAYANESADKGLTTVLAGDTLTVEVVQVGSTVAGSDLTVTLHLSRK